MPYEVAITAIEDALRAVLIAYAPLTALLATKAAAAGGGPAIYDDGAVPTGATMPYLTIGAWTQIPFHTLGAEDTDKRWGWNCTGQLKAVGQNRLTEDPIRLVMSRVFSALPQGKRLTVVGYDSAWCDEFNLMPTLKSTVSGVVTFEVPAILRVFVHDD